MEYPSQERSMNSSKVDIMLDSARGIGIKQEGLREIQCEAVFQGGESDEIADVFFHGYANYERWAGLSQTDFVQHDWINPCCRLSRSDVRCDRVAITIVRRVADPAIITAV